jgi:hypothetical protein
MAFPAQYFYSILDVAGRWGCSQTEVVNWAIAGELDLVFGDEPAAGLLVVSAADVRPLFRPFGKAAKKVVRRRMIWNSRADFVADGLGSSGSGYAA